MLAQKLDWKKLVRDVNRPLLRFIIKCLLAMIYFTSLHKKQIPWGTPGALNDKKSLHLLICHNRIIVVTN